MDNLTHSLLGVTLCRAGLNRLTPQAGWLMLAAANLPDADIVMRVQGSAHYLHTHRGWTHSVYLAPLVALLPLVLWWLLTRKSRPGLRQWIGAYVVSLLGVISHLAFDWTNVYGIRLHLPFDPSWFRLDLIYIIDLWIWALLFVAVAGPLLVRLVNSEIGAKGGSGRGLAWFALILLSVYIGGREFAHQRAAETLESRVYSGETPRRVAAVPGPVNPFVWRGIVETANAWHLVEVNLLRDFDPDARQLFYKPQPHPAIDVARRTTTGRIFLDFASFPVWQVLPSPEGGDSTLVEITDLRFAAPGEGRFTATIEVDPAGRVKHEEFAFGALRTDR